MKRFWFLAVTLCLGLTSVSAAQEKMSVKKKSSRPEPKVFLIGTELRQYKYSESTANVEHSGLMYGVWAEWYWNSLIGDGKLYGNILFGALDYSGALCADLNDPTTCSPYSAKTNDVISRINSRLEFKLNPRFQLSVGAGYRYLYDKGEGAGFYTRTGQWGYLPLGLAFNVPTSFGQFVFDLEYDLILFGQMKSDLAALSSGTNQFDDVTHAQTGYGMLLNTGVQINETWSAYFVYEYWSLNSSTVTESHGHVLTEPQNNAQSFGLRIGYTF